MEQVKKWFLENRRALPWRVGKDPYRVLVSEVMLQQTRAVVVVSYFEEWMKRFPTVHALSLASEEEIMKLWEGLGYYSRGRNLLKLAKRVVLEYGGEIPDQKEELLKLEGLGTYTAGAVLAFGFHQKAVALDGNVTRVMARWLAFEKCGRKHAAELEREIYDHLPEQEPYVVMEGLIELGALICKKKPLCNLCPLQTTCKAHAQGLTDVLPILPERKKVTELFRAVGCIIHEGAYLVKQGEKGKVMAGLFEFPYIACEQNPPTHHKEFETLCGSPLTLLYPLLRERHHFTRFRANLYPFHFRAKEKKMIPHHVWIPKDRLTTLPFSAGHKKILMQLMR